MNQVVTMTFFKYHGWNKIWAMKQMRDGKRYMKNEHGIVFYKMLGTGGKAGYSLWPDFSVYGLLCVWQDELDADRFFNESLTYKNFVNHSIQQFTIYMYATSTRGSWSKQSPFICREPDPLNPYLSVLTRATLKNKYLYQFWKRVPLVSKSQEGFEGLLFSKGVGEIPFLEQATFTVWNSVELMKEFAYKSKFHAEAVKKTREMDGFKEEMFTRFQPYKTSGSWDNLDWKIG